MPTPSAKKDTSLSKLYWLERFRFKPIELEKNQSKAIPPMILGMAKKLFETEPMLTPKARYGERLNEFVKEIVCAAPE